MPTDLNFTSITGHVEGVKVYKDAMYPWAWIKLGIERVPYVDIDGETKIIKPSTLFISFNVAKNKIGVFDNIEKGQWLSAWEVFFDDYKKDGKTFYKLRGSVSKILTSPRSMQPANVVVVAGRVSDQSKDGLWYRIGMSYLNPLEKDQRKKWKMRCAKIFSPYLKFDIGSRYFITGAISGAAPDGVSGPIILPITASKGS